MKTTSLTGLIIINTNFFAQFGIVGQNCITNFINFSFSAKNMHSVDNIQSSIVTPFFLITISMNSSNPSQQSINVMFNNNTSWKISDEQEKITSTVTATNKPDKTGRTTLESVVNMLIASLANKFGTVWNIKNKIEEL